MSTTSVQRSVLALLAAAILAYQLLAPGAARDVYYDLVDPACMACAVTALRRWRPAGRRSWLLVVLTAVLDAAIVATGCAVLVGVFVVAPIAHDSSMGIAGRLTASFYPVADVLLLASWCGCGPVRGRGPRRSGCWSRRLR